ncbi:MAG: hypothetical protein ACM3PT_03770 [Deltaproteobacteria bacterium]
MRNIKFISIFILLCGFTFALVQCTKDENANEQHAQITLKSTNVIKALTDAGIYTASDVDLTPRENLYSSCKPSGTYCTSYFIRDTIAVPNFCDYVQVKYYLWVCPDGISFSDFEAIPLGGCDSLTNSWLYLSNGELDHQLELFNYNASLIVEKELMSLLVTQYQIKCSGGQFISSFYRNICYRWCVQFITDPRGVVFTSTVKNYCGDKCCKRTTKYCLEDNGQVQISDTVFSEVGNGVCGSIPYGDPCRGYQIGSCQKTCGLP